MKLHFLGANRQVTGSRYCLEVAGERVMIDCGMFQERPFADRNWESCPVPADQCGSLLLTHVHIDHSGLIPRLVGEGFWGPIYATSASVDLAEPMLRDAAGIQVEDAAYKKRRHQREGRRGKHPEVPLYTEVEVEQALPLLQRVEYGKPVEVTPNVSATFHDAGHILGSAMIEVNARENGRTRRIIFSGDIGQWDKPLVRDPTTFDSADYVIMESTYGDREHEDGGDVATQLAGVINDTHRRGGNVVIPTFAVERAQELMYFLGGLVRSHRIPEMPVFLDSPMAIDITDIYRRHPECYDEEMRRLLAEGTSPLRFAGLTMTHTTEESKAINDAPGPAIIMSTSGMCTAGRIKHHLRQNITRPECTILFVGYQANGTLGRQIVDGNPYVRIHGKDHPVRAKVAKIFGFSGHADRSGLVRWIGSFSTSPPRHVFLTHGEESAALSLAGRIGSQFGFAVTVPEYQTEVELE